MVNVRPRAGGFGGSGTVSGLLASVLLVPVLLVPVLLVSVLLTAAIFGFFYAWVCSTMWGLDAADPRIAIPAMQAMNASVRNVVFAPAFFATPFALALTAVLARAHRLPRAALLFGAAALVYAGGALAPTLLVNVPMNETLALVTVPADLSEARAIWTAYSGTWQAWNLARTVASGIALLLAVGGVAAVARDSVNRLAIARPQPATPVAGAVA